MRDAAARRIINRVEGAASALRRMPKDDRGRPGAPCACRGYCTPAASRASNRLQSAGVQRRPRGYCPPAASRASRARAPPSMRGIEWCPSWQAYSHFSPSSACIGTSKVHGRSQVSGSSTVAW